MKIFGIGLGKTGTTSLHFALELLGFRSVHASTLLCDIINQEAQQQRPLLSTLDQHYDVFLDWPISYLYSELDCRFPGSKFILTVRDARRRYQSALRHVEEDIARRKRGLSYAWIGVESEEAFVREDEHHTAEVISYFERRPADLLVMRITEGDGWIQLCNFLRLKIPLEPFPYHRAHGSYDSHFLRSSPVCPHETHFDLNSWRKPIPMGF